VPLATWQAVAQSEAATVLTCTAPYSAQLAAALASYTGATLRIDGGQALFGDTWELP